MFRICFFLLLVLDTETSDQCQHTSEPKYVSTKSSSNSEEHHGYDMKEYLGTIKLLPQPRQWSYPKTASHIKLNN